MLYLPLEIWQLVLLHLTYPATICKARLVCKLFNDILTPLMFSGLVIGIETDALQRFGEVSRYEPLVCMVKELHIMSQSFDFTKTEACYADNLKNCISRSQITKRVLTEGYEKFQIRGAKQRKLEKNHSYIKTFASAFTRFPELKIVSIGQHPPRGRGWTHLYHQKSIEDEVLISPNFWDSRRRGKNRGVVQLRALLGSNHAQIQTLRMDIRDFYGGGYETCTLNKKEIELAKKTFSKVSAFELILPSKFCTPDKGALSLRSFLSTMPSLTILSLDFPRRAYYISWPTILLDIEFCHLTTLRLGSAIAHQRQLADFLRRHIRVGVETQSTKESYILQGSAYDYLPMGEWLSSRPTEQKDLSDGHHLDGMLFDGPNVIIR